MNQAELTRTDAARTGYPQGDAPTPTEALDAVERLLDGQRIAMLSHADADGRLRAKPLTVLRHDPLGPFWFYIRDDGHPSDAAYRQVNLAFQNDGDYVSISGTGQVVRDRQRIQAYWTPAARPFFPEGPDAPDLALLRVDPVHAEYWDGPSNALTRGLAMAASVISGKPVGLGEHGEADYGTR